MALDDQLRDNDLQFSSHDVSIIVDDRTMAYLQKATIAFVNESGRSGFQIQQEKPQTAFSGCSGCDPSAGGCG